jgi:chaperone modulatory protein CbpM
MEKGMIETSLTVELTLEEVCEIADVPTEVLITIVEEGILEPTGTSPKEWYFDTYMLSIAKRASRLHRDFDIEWTGIPLYLDMIEELEKLRTENKTLKQRLGRFLLE